MQMLMTAIDRNYVRFNALINFQSCGMGKVDGSLVLPSTHSVPGTVEIHHIFNPS